MTILALRILPPFAIGRLGSASEPADNYTIEENPQSALDFRSIKGAETLVVDEASGEISWPPRIPETLEFKLGARIRPVAPFLEVFAQTSSDSSKPLEPLTLELLSQYGLDERNVFWRVSVANRKVVRRTGSLEDLVEADTRWFSSHDSQCLKGICENFVPGDNSFIDFGRVRYIKPNARFPQIRLRFTPARGLIYGPNVGKADPAVPKERQIYDASKGGWYNFDAHKPPRPFYNETLPSSLFAISSPAPSWLHDDIAISRGYLDDACDGFAEVSLRFKDGNTLNASARICASPPAIVPDSLFLRNLADDLEQIIAGPDVDPEDEDARANAEDIIRRAYETVRFLNISVMNGNPVQGRAPLSLDTMPAEEAFDTQRPERPVMPPATMDTLAILALHQQLFAALRSGSGPWFLRLIRKPEEAADYTDEGRRKMPALMCGADNNYLALTRRQIGTIRAAANDLAFSPNLTWNTSEDDPAKGASQLTPRNLSAQVSYPAPGNLSAQVNYAARGNPVSSRPISAVANCCPGLEVDFRAVWRRIFEGLVLREWDNLVIDVDSQRDDLKKLKGHRLLRINGVKVMAQKKGPSPADRFGSVLLATQNNPDAVQPLEWSNVLARYHQGGGSVTCDFTQDEVWNEQVWWDDDQPPPHQTMDLKFRPFFDGATAVISPTLAGVGELTQGLCSPWQNDYRECSCYYWASSRPDYVNVEPSLNGTSQGDNWLQKERTGQYVPDDYVDSRLILYDDLFLEWEKWLRFQVRGRDVPETPEGTP